MEILNRWNNEMESEAGPVYDTFLPYDDSRRKQRKCCHKSNFDVNSQNRYHHHKSKKHEKRRNQRHHHHGIEYWYQPQRTIREEARNHHNKYNNSRRKKSFIDKISYDSEELARPLLLTSAVLSLLFCLLQIPIIIIRAQGGLTRECTAAALVTHNKLRQMHKDTPPMEEGLDFALDFTHKWVKNLAENIKTLQHSSEGKYGENLHWKSWQTKSDAVSIEACSYSILSYYTEIYNWNFATSTKTGVTGHFTQLIWAQKLPGNKNPSLAERSRKQEKRKKKTMSQ